jgi:CRP-like cAMP-binding protein
MTDHLPEQAILRKVALFSRLDDAVLAEIAAVLRRRHLEAGEVLFNLGDPGEELIIVAQGRLSIYAPSTENPQLIQPIRIFQAGELLGEMALIDRKPRSLSARAEDASHILTLHGDDFRRLLAQNPDIALAVMTGLSDRIRYTTDFLSEVRRWVKLISDGSYQPGAALQPNTHADPGLAALAAEFTQMAARVHEREESLRREVTQLRIEIDQSRRKREVEQITGSDYYKKLKEQARNIRRQNE